MQVKLNGNDFFQVSSTFGEVSKIHPNGHTGIDIVMNEGTKLFSLSDGFVDRVVDYGDKNIGKGVIIRTEDGESLIYGHLSDNSFVRAGQEIHKGDFIGLSGNTGRSTGAHLHLGLKDEDGNFIEPSKYLENNENFFREGNFIDDHGGIITKLMHKHNEKAISVDDGGGFLDGIQSFGEFMEKWIDSGSFWIAIYDKPFFEVMRDFLKELGHDILVFILSNGDIFLLMPAIAFMFGTFFIGKNRFTKWILPLWFFYFVTTILHKLIL